MITHYDLFAGIGGFSYALDTVFHDQEIKHIFCEWEAFPTAVLKKHWPDSTYYGDIADLVADTERERLERSRCNSKRHTGLSHRKGANKDEGLTILTGGFPCQPFSHAGRRKGTADNRYKWPEMFAVIRNVQPDWIIAENVRGLASWNDGMVLETVCTDLEGEGYEVQPFIVPAAGVGAPHRRDRVWIIARSQSERDRRCSSKKRRVEEWFMESSEQEGSEVRSEGEGRTQFGGFWEDDWREVAFDTSTEIILGTEDFVEEDDEGEPQHKVILSIPTPARNDGVDDGLSRRLDGATLRGKVTNQISAAQHRKERLKACGNAIVPQVAMQFFAAIRESKVL